MTDGALIAIVSSKSVITALLGSSPLRLYPEVLPQTPAYPCATYRDVSERFTDDFDDLSDMNFSNVDFHFYSNEKLEAKTVALTFRDQMIATSGTFDSVVVSDVRYQPSGFSKYSDVLEKYIYHIELQFTTK